MIHDGQGVVRAKGDLGLSEDLRSSIPRAINISVRQELKLGYPTPDIVAVWVKLFSLRKWVEDPEVGLGITAASRGPLPSSIVLSPVSVGKVL